MFACWSRSPVTGLGAVLALLVVHVVRLRQRPRPRPQSQLCRGFPRAGQAAVARGRAHVDDVVRQGQQVHRGYPHVLCSGAPSRAHVADDAQQDEERVRDERRDRFRLCGSGGLPAASTCRCSYETAAGWRRAPAGNMPGQHCLVSLPSRRSTKPALTAKLTSNSASTKKLTDAQRRLWPRRCLAMEG